jgi:hypothetical protein
MLGKMDLPTAQKAIRRGAIAGFIVAALGLAVVSAAVWGPADGPLARLHNPWNFLDAVAFAACAFGVLRRSRVAAIALFGLYLVSQIILYIEMGRPAGVLWMMVFVYFFGKAIQGTYAYHRIRKEQDPAYRPVKKAMLFVWVPVGAVGVVLIGLVLFGVYEVSKRQFGEALASGSSIPGAVGWYALSAPDGGWIRVAPGTINEDTDLELYGNSTDTWAIAYVDCHADYDLDDLVEFRRNQIKAEVKELSVSEERLMMRESFLPVSYARYAGRIPVFADDQVWWVASVVAFNASIEIVASTSRGPKDEESTEQLVKSLRLTREADSLCAQ